MATRRLQAGTRVSYEGSEFEIAHTVLEGHRFAVEPIAEGEDLLSWGLRFGRATREIEPGDYACNEKILRVLRERFRGLAPTRGRSRGNFGPGRGTRPRRTEQGRPRPARRAELQRRGAGTLRPGRGEVSARPAGTAPRRGAHLYGLQARAWQGRRDAQLRGRDGRDVEAHRVCQGAGAGDEGCCRRLRERGRHSVRRPHGGRGGAHPEQPGRAPANPWRLHGQPERRGRARARPRRRGGRDEPDAPGLSRRSTTIR